MVGLGTATQPNAVVVDLVLEVVVVVVEVEVELDVVAVLVLQVVTVVVLVLVLQVVVTLAGAEVARDHGVTHEIRRIKTTHTSTSLRATTIMGEP